MKHEDLVNAAKEASLSIAETAIATPYIFQEWQDWQACVRNLHEAERDLMETREKWRKVIQPALSDPLLSQLAIRKGLIPNGS